MEYFFPKCLFFVSLTWKLCVFGNKWVAYISHYEIIIINVTKESGSWGLDTFIINTLPSIDYYDNIHNSI